MKKIVLFLMIVCTLASLTACGGSSNNEETWTNTNNVITIDGIYALEGENTVVVFYTVNATDGALSLSSKTLTMVIDGKSYAPNTVSDTPNRSQYIYDSAPTTVATGSNLKVAQSFEVPAAELATGKAITFTSQKDFAAGICLKTEEIKKANSFEEMCKGVDEAYYNQQQAVIDSKQQQADEQTVQKVKNAIYGKKYSFTSTGVYAVVSYEIKFVSIDRFEFTNSVGNTAAGTYEIRSGCIMLQFENADSAMQFPTSVNWEENSGEIVIVDPFATEGGSFF